MTKKEYAEIERYIITIAFTQPSLSTMVVDVRPVLTFLKTLVKESK